MDDRSSAPPESGDASPESARTASPETGGPYPPAPAGPLPPIGATTTYRLRVFFVLASLLLFVAFYLAVLAGSAWLVWASISEVGWLSGKGVILNLGLVVGSAMLFLFLLKGLFHRRPFDDDHLVEITEAEEPRLFAFLRRLATDAGSKLPKHVYLSPDVNAAVMYRQSLLALVWPVRKNLVLGLGLVNALDVAELKAVLAHEFGHFSQASMRLGTYVYMANGVVADLVYGRDRWDDALRAWQRVDLRLSFPAWILAGVVWVLRKILDLAFKLLTLARLSLSRQMEFNADANAVRLAGSDAIVSGLWKSERAQLAFSHALSGLASVAEHGKASRDVFFHQGRSLARLDKTIGKDPQAKEHFASILARYQPGPEPHFRADGEQVSTLWRTHPPHHEREAAAKSPYVPSPRDPRSAWALFSEPKRVRRKLSKTLYASMGVENLEALPAREVEELVEEERGEMEQAAHYQGLYENRVVAPGDIEALRKKIDERAEAGTLDVAALREKAAAFTGEALREKTERLEKLRGEQHVIAAIRGGAELKEKKVEFRGEKRTRAGILGLEGEVNGELRAASEELEKADVRFFRYYYAIAREDLDHKAELLLRYRFLLGVQALLLDLARFEGPFESIVQKIQSRSEFGEEDVANLRSVAYQARDAVGAALHRARKLERPPLTLLAEDRRLDRFLLDEPLVEELPSHEIPGSWLGDLLRQHGLVLRRLRKLHFKNLGALLALGERLDPRLFPKAQETTDDKDAPDDEA